MEPLAEYESDLARILHAAAIRVAPSVRDELAAEATRLISESTRALESARQFRGDADYQTAYAFNEITPEVEALFGSVSAALVEIHGLLSTVERMRERINQYADEAAQMKRDLDAAAEAEFGFKLSPISVYLSSVPPDGWARWRQWRDPWTLLPADRGAEIERTIEREVAGAAPPPGSGGKLFTALEICRELKAAPSYKNAPLQRLDEASAIRDRAAEVLREVRGDLRVHQEWVLSNLRAKESNERAEEAEERALEESRRTRFEGSVAVVAAVFVPAGVVAGVYGANVWKPPAGDAVGDVTTWGMALTLFSVSLLGGAFARWIAPVPRGAADRSRDLVFAGLGVIVGGLLSVYLWLVCSLRPEDLDGLCLRPLHRVEAVFAAIAASAAAVCFGARFVRIDRTPKHDDAE